MPKDIKKDIESILSSGVLPNASAEESAVDGAGSSDIGSEVSRISSKIDRTEKYDKPLAAATAGLARGVSMGLSDPLLTKFAGVDPKTLKGLEEVNPVASTASEIVGTGAGLFIPGGPVAGAARLGRGIESALIAKAALSAAEKSAVRRIAAKSTAAAAGAAAEGALYGTGQLISEGSLGDAEFNAQNLISAAGSGAVLGGLVGGAFGTAFSSADELGNVFKRDGKLKRAAVRELDEQSNAIDLLAPKGVERARLEKLSNDIGPNDAKIDFAKYARDNLELEFATTRSDLYRKNLEVQNKAANDIKNVVKSLDEASAGSTISASQFESNILNNVKNQLGSEFKNPKKFESALNGIKKEFKKEFYVGTKGEAVEQLTPSKIYEFMQRMGKESFDSTKPDLEKIVYSKAWGATKDTIREFVEKSGNPDLAKLWQEANHNFRISKLLDKPLAMRAQADAPIADLKDALLGASAAALGGPMAAAAAVTANRFLESDLKRKLIVLGSVEKSAANNIKRIGSSVKNFFESSVKGVRKSSVPVLSTIFHVSGLSQDYSKPRSPVEPKNDKQAFKNMSANVSEYISNPDKLAKQVAAVTQKMDRMAPNTAQAARETLVRSVEFLDSKLPRDRNQPFDLFQSQREFSPSSQVLAKFKRYVQVVEDPYSVLDDLESGTATKEHVEALQAVYPAIYNKIRTEMLDYVVKNPTEVSFNKKVQMGILLDAPVTPAMRGKSLANLQATFIPKDKESEGGQIPTTVGGLSELNLAKNESTSIQKVQSGDFGS